MNTEKAISVSAVWKTEYQYDMALAHTHTSVKKRGQILSKLGTLWVCIDATSSCYYEEEDLGNHPCRNMDDLMSDEFLEGMMSCWCCLTADCALL